MLLNIGCLTSAQTFDELLASQQDTSATMSPVVAYWKTLSPAEKEIYLFSYLTQVFETQEELKAELGYDDITRWYYDHRAEMVYGIFEALEITDMSEFVKWIDEFYRHEEYVDQPFYEALEFAYRFQQAEGETMWEKYENLNFDEIKPK